jgi:hypothetical protein
MSEERLADSYGRQVIVTNMHPSFGKGMLDYRYEFRATALEF